MKSRTFESINGLGLIVQNRKSAVIFKMEQNQTNEKFKFSFKFTPEVLLELLNHIESVSGKSWINLNPKEAESMGADYDEYFDRELDCNGYLSIRKNELLIERPSLESGKLYQFNKKKMESFIYDFRKLNGSRCGVVDVNYMSKQEREL